VTSCRSGTDREGQQPLPRRADDVSERDRRLGRHRHLGRGRSAPAARLLLKGLTHGGPLPRGVLGGSPERPTRRQGSGGGTTATSSSTRAGQPSCRRHEELRLGPRPDKPIAAHRPLGAGTAGIPQLSWPSGGVYPDANVTDAGGRANEKGHRQTRLYALRRGVEADLIPTGRLRGVQGGIGCCDQRVDGSTAAGIDGHAE